MNRLGIRLLVNKFNDTFSFYKEKLGLDVTWGKLGEVYASFKIDGETILSIFEKQLMNNFLNIEDATNHFSDNALIVIGCKSVDNEYQRLLKRGVKFLNEPTDKPGWGMRCVHLRDPEGNLIELFSDLAREQWSEDLQESAEEYNYKEN